MVGGSWWVSLEIRTPRFRRLVKARGALDLARDALSKNSNSIQYVLGGI